MFKQITARCILALVLLSTLALADDTVKLAARQFPGTTLPGVGSSSAPSLTSLPPVTSSSSSFSSFTPIVTLTGLTSSSALSSASTASIPTSSVISTSSVPPTTSTTSTIITSSSITPITSTSLVISSSATPTQTAQPANSGSSMSPSTTRIVIIAVSTVGGVLVLGLIGFFWRKLGRRRKDAEAWGEDDFFGPPAPVQPQMQQYNYNHHDPFKTTLDQYHRSN